MTVYFLAPFKRERAQFLIMPDRIMCAGDTQGVVNRRVLPEAGKSRDRPGL